MWYTVTYITTEGNFYSDVLFNSPPSVHNPCRMAAVKDKPLR
jgi:hypothetical protein